MAKLTVIDFFCGAGGFSEGFSQNGYEIIAGYDHWKPAVETYSHNFGKGKGILKDIRAFETSVEEIEALPDSDIILGSPPCVTFSSSNISGQADKKLGIQLTQIFLRIVAVKKWKKGSILKAWYMENVPSSIKHLGKQYTFEELGLGEWATKQKIGRTKVAVKLEGNQAILNSADYGSLQARQRVIAGEVIKKRRLIVPTATHSCKPDNQSIKPWKTLKDLIIRMPSPTCTYSARKVSDPNYPELSIPLNKLTDHFYDTGLFECEWKQSRFLKVNHPYMGRMSFPENCNKPSRTITATKIGTSRESIIYKSDYKRTGDGEFRTPTVREAACIMGFPITYQFLGGETTKWRLVGNAVCPSVSRLLAEQVLNEYRSRTIPRLILRTEPVIVGINDLNTFSPKQFLNPPRRNKGSRFRRHPFKHGNITVTLSNYLIDDKTTDTTRWITSVQYGNGDGFPTFYFADNFYKEIEPIIKKSKAGKAFIDTISNGFSEKIGTAVDLQHLYEVQKSSKRLLDPCSLVEEVDNIISKSPEKEEIFEQAELVVFKNKSRVPMSQLLALYAISKISSIANSIS